MNPQLTHDNSWALVEAVANRADSLSEGSQFLQAVTGLLQQSNLQWQLKQDEQRRGHLMREIYQVSSRLGIASHELRSLKAMTTPKLEAYAEELYRQLGNSSL